jgi:phosphatidylserine/phosphatidylglycerophosphate/cardiolipin synthase-like enzyme
MRYHLPKIIVTAILLMLAVPARAADVRVCLTPGENCTAIIVSAIDGARRSLLVQQYELTSPELAGAIIRAHQRGVAVRVLLDRRVTRYSDASVLVREGIPVAIDSGITGIAHNKIAILDGETVIGGSFNWTQSAQKRNAENVLVIRDAPLASRMTANFDLRASGSRPYTGVQSAASGSTRGKPVCGLPGHRRCRVTHGL